MTLMSPSLCCHSLSPHWHGAGARPLHDLMQAGGLDTSIAQVCKEPGVPHRPLVHSPTLWQAVRLRGQAVHLQGQAMRLQGQAMLTLEDSASQHDGGQYMHITHSSGLARTGLQQDREG